MHIKINNINRILGISLDNALKGETLRVWQKGLITSKDPNFIKFIDSLTHDMFVKANLIPDGVVQFLAVQHQNFSVDMWVNDFNKYVEARVKRKVLKGEFLYLDNIADIRSMKFDDQIKILPDDNIILVIKVGWNQGMYIDLTRHENPSDYRDLQLELGNAYKRMSYDYLFDTIPEHVKETISKDGWFPYIELLGNDYKILQEAYKTDFAIEEKVSKVVKSFTPDRIDKITNKWWENAIFSKHSKALKAGINALKSNNEDNNVLAIKCLYTEAEGIIRNSYFVDKNIGKGRSNILFDYAKDKATLKADVVDSLFFQNDFIDFLRTNIYENFDLATGELTFSRNTISHGVASADSYSRERALQGLLIIDQLFFYLS